ncbi:hypothetical protein [Micromonospora sp. NPDC048947]|uniref:hypothetical protein n=1 Tax=Micromonospora sp. NPDC048947 TaxID=3154826 RepID=UPI0033C4E5E3
MINGRLRAAAMAAAVVTVGFVGYALGTWSGPAGSPAAAETPVVEDPPAAPAPAAGTGRDALTPNEIAIAREVAVDAALRAETTDVTGAPGPELLSVALAGGDGPRRAAVLLYDYRDDRLIKRVIDLAGRAVAGSFSASDRQPPPTEREVATATDLLWADPAAKLLRERFHTATGRDLTARSDVEVEAQTVPDGTGAAAACGAHRCLMLLPRPRDAAYLDLTDLVIDLSTRKVVQR